MAGMVSPHKEKVLENTSRYSMYVSLERLQKFEESTIAQSIKSQNMF